MVNGNANVHVFETYTLLVDCLLMFQSNYDVMKKKCGYIVNVLNFKPRDTISKIEISSKCLKR